MGVSNASSDEAARRGQRWVSEPVGWFVGRRDALDVIAAAASEARIGRAGVIWVEGEAGAGKSMLVRRALADLRDFTPVVAEADELAADVPFGLLGQLLDTRQDDPFAVGLELLAWLGDLQDQGPVALLIEDLHWADAASRLALLTAVRRMLEDRVLVLLTARPESGSSDDGWLRLRLDESRCRRVAVGALSAAELAELAVTTGLQLNRRDCERLHRHTGGHALYVRMLLTELTPAQLAAPGAELPVPRSLAAAVVGRLAELSPRARNLAAALAVWNQRVPLATLGWIAGVDSTAAALEELLATGFVVYAPGEPGFPVRFAHPLYSAAVYADLPPTRRRQLHLAAARMADASGALLHRVSAADGPDERLASELEAAAGEARKHQMPALSARYLSWASDLSIGRAERERRQLQSARVLLAADPGGAEALRPQLERYASSPLRDLVLGKLAWRRGEQARTEELLRAAADSGSPTDIAAEALMALGLHYAVNVRGQDLLAVAKAALQLPQLDGGVVSEAQILLAFAIAEVDGPVPGLAVLTGHLPVPASQVLPADAEVLVNRGILAFFARRYGQAAEDLRAVIGLVRQGGVTSELARAHIYLAWALLILGDWDAALVNGHVALTIGADAGQQWPRATAYLVTATVAASRGAWQDANDYVRAAQYAAASADTPESRYAAGQALATLHRARAEHDGVVAALSPLTGGNDGRAIPVLSYFSWWHTLIGSLIETGDLSAAAEQAGHFEAAAAARSLNVEPLVIDLRGRLAAARGQPEAAMAAFRQALALAGPDFPLLERADLHHRYGRLLHACGNRQGAIAQLRLARQLLQPVGARPYLERIDADLTRCGISADRGSARPPLALTEREQDVVTLVARGLTNREVAAALYVSPKAVEYHLGNVFGKLGITSRRQLRHATIAGPLH